MKKEYLDVIIRVCVEVVSFLSSYLKDKVNGRSQKDGRKKSSKKKRKS